MKLRIAPDGTVSGLWSDELCWAELGRVSVRRASQVEFCARRQRWYVQAAQPSSRVRRVRQLILRRPCGEIRYWADTRQEAVRWEREFYAPGGPGWPELRPTRDRPNPTNLVRQPFHRVRRWLAHPVKPHWPAWELKAMTVLHMLFQSLFAHLGRRRHVERHHKHQAYGRRWSPHRWRQIGPYQRRPPRRWR
jgi:hypothetical protein